MTKMPLLSELRANLTFLGCRGTVGSASQSEAMTVAVGFSPRGGSAKTGVAERRLKGSIGSSVQASLRDAHSFHTIIPWAQAHGYHHVVTPRLPQN